MTIQELSKYHKIKAEIEQLETNIEELESTTIRSSKIIGMPISIGSINSSNPTERIGTKLAYLKTKLIAKRERLLDEATKIEDFLATVDDAEIRIIIRKRFFEGKTWNTVSKEIIADRSTPYYRLKKYLETRLVVDEENKKNNRFI